MLPLALSVAVEPVVLAASLNAPVAVVEPAEIVGASLVPLIVIVTSWLAVPPWPSLTVTVNFSVTSEQPPGVYVALVASGWVQVTVPAGAGIASVLNTE